MVKGCMDAGGAGVSIGRNVFQHSKPTKIVEAISKIVHGGISVQEALNVMN
jgi:DhnA family fructose-bisphosphate aldolase class Ia